MGWGGFDACPGRAVLRRAVRTTVTASHHQLHAWIHYFHSESIRTSPLLSQLAPFMAMDKREDPSGCSFLGCVLLACWDVLSRLPTLPPSAAVARCLLMSWPGGFQRQALAKCRQVGWPASTMSWVPRASAIAWGRGLGSSKGLQGPHLAVLRGITCTNSGHLWSIRACFPDSFHHEHREMGLFKTIILLA